MAGCVYERRACMRRKMGSCWLAADVRSEVKTCATSAAGKTGSSSGLTLEMPSLAAKKKNLDVKIITVTFGVFT